MKFLKLFLLAIGITISLYSCQQDLDFISDDAQLKMNEQSITKLKDTRSSFQKEYMPLDSVPEWAKQMMTNEEFNLWKIMSTRYKIDYSFLNMNLNEKQKEELYYTLNIICKKIENNTWGKGDLGYFVVQTINKRNFNSIERLSDSESNETHTSDPVIIYRAKETDFAYVEVSATFVTNK